MLRVGEESKSIVAMGRVIWRQAEGEQVVRTGLKFVALTYEAREAIKDFIPVKEGE